MGNRTNIGFRGPSMGDHTLYLYAHWGFDRSIGEVLNICENRWDDDAYAIRRAIVLFLNDDGADETGYGLSIDTLHDNENTVWIIDFNEQTVSSKDDEEFYTFGDPALLSITPGGY